MTDLQKSHSKVSNFKLTLICLGLTLFTSIFWLSVASLFIDIVDSYISYVTLALGVLGSLFFYKLIDKFTR